MVDRLDEERIEALKVWGTGLAVDSHDALRAAGRAIVILVDEIERLRVEAAQAPERQGQPFIGARDGVPLQVPVEAASSQSLGASLRERLGVGIRGSAEHT